MSIKQKLLASFLFLAFLTLGVSLSLSLVHNDKILDVFEEIGGKEQPGNLALSRLTTELYHTLVLMDRFKTSRDSETRREIERAISSLDIHKTTHELYDKDDKKIGEIERIVHNFNRLSVQYLLAIQNGKDDKGAALIRLKLDKILQTFFEDINPDIEQEFIDSNQRIYELKKGNKQQRLLLISSICGLIILTITLSFFISNLLAKPIRILRDAAVKIGNGEHGIRLSVTSKDEIGDLTLAFNQMTDSIMQREKDLHHEIINRKNIEADLRSNQLLLQRILESTRDAILTVNENGGVNHYNRRFVELWRIPGKVIKEKSDSSLIQYVLSQLEDPDKFSTRIQELYNSTEEGFDLIHLNDERVFERYSIPLIQDEKITGRVWCFSDISERVRVERERQLDAQQLRELNKLQDKLLLPGDVQDKLLSITDVGLRVFWLDFCRIWVIKPGDLCSSICIHSASNPPLCSGNKECLHLIASSGRYTHLDGDHGRVPMGAFKIGKIASGDTKQFLTNEVSKDPRVHNHAWAKELGLKSFAGYRLMDRLGECVGVLAMFSKNHLSEREDSLLLTLAQAASNVIISGRVDENLQDATEAAQFANQAKTRFLAHMSHEIRTPLNAILGMNEILVESNLSEEQRTYLQTSKNAGETLLSLISDMLDLSKIELIKWILSSLISTFIN